MESIPRWGFSGLRGDPVDSPTLFTCIYQSRYNPSSPIEPPAGKSIPWPMYCFRTYLLVSYCPCPILPTGLATRISPPGTERDERRRSPGEK